MSQLILLKLYKSELLYDIRNKSYLAGESRETVDNYKQVSDMQVGEDDIHINQILRSIGNAMGLLKTVLSPYIENNMTYRDNILIDFQQPAIDIEMRMPDNYNLAMNGVISGGLHQYIVNMALLDWYGIVRPDEAEGYEKLARGNLMEIMEAINKRVRPQKKNKYA